MKIFRGLLAAGLIAAFTDVSDAATVLKEEPGKGKLSAGEKVLVDNGKCPKGQVLEIIGGGNRKMRTGDTEQGSKRTQRCVPRP